MGKQAFTEIQKKAVIESNPAINKYVQCVANRLLGVSKDQTGVSDWNVVVFKDDSPNAFALPGGSIGVNTGILKLAQSQSQLATVIGHEIAHVIARHGAERMSQALLAQGGLVLADQALKNSDHRNKIMAAVGIGTQFGVMLPFSRKHESEADEMGLTIMARAGFDPSESVKLWQNMSKNSKGAPPEFLSTHPANTTRIKRLQSKIPKADLIYRKSVQKMGSPHCST
jgi:predicted Zn-dependent protease